MLLVQILWWGRNESHKNFKSTTLKKKHSYEKILDISLRPKYNKLLCIAFKIIIIVTF
jgi:hypothetical protein